jgi:hypothetical protein
MVICSFPHDPESRDPIVRDARPSPDSLFALEIRARWVNA